jgi:subtilisin family serine protease
MKSSLPILGLAFTFFIFGCSKMNHNHMVQSPADLGADAASNKKPKKKSKYVDGAYIVVFKKHIKDVDLELDDLGKKHKVKSKHRFKHVLKGFSGEMTPELVELLRMDPRVDYIEQDQLVSVDNSQYNPPSWGLDRTDQRALPLNGSYNYNHTAQGVDAYIFDTGIRLTHEDFSGRAIMGFDAFPDQDPASDAHGHGTHVAGTVGGDRYGVAKGIRLIAIRVLGKDGNGYMSDLAAGIDWMTNHHTTKPAVGNMSLSGGSSQFMEDALRQAVADGITICVAAGNGGIDADNCSPAKVREAITVGGTNINDSYVHWNYGSAVDILAPGVDITSAYHLSDNAIASMSGTSMATPHVTGAAAIYLQLHPYATPAEVEEAIKLNGTVNLVSGVPDGTNNLLLNADFRNPPPPATPFAVGLKLPENFTTGEASSPVLSWYPAAGADYYSVEISTSPDFSNIAFSSTDITRTSVSGVLLNNETSYFWRVRATNAMGTGAWSPTWSFTTASANSSSRTPVTHTPYEGRTEVIVPTTLAWHPCIGARSYRVQVSTNPSFTEIVYKQSDLNARSVIVKGLMPNTIYYWRVAANYITSMSPWSPANSFKTVSSGG